MKLTSILLGIALTLAVFYTLFLIVSAMQIANDRAKCEVPLDRLSRADYQYCLMKGDK